MDGQTAEEIVRMPDEEMNRWSDRHPMAIVRVVSAFVIVKFSIIFFN